MLMWQWQNVKGVLWAATPVLVKLLGHAQGLRQLTGVARHVSLPELKRAAQINTRWCCCCKWIDFAATWCNSSW